MLRITRIESPNSLPTLKLEGKLLEPWIPELLSMCAAAESVTGPLHLDLSELCYADHAGASVLRELIDRGYAVSACSGFIAELLHLELS
ncbi:hypothetical protein BH10PLA2_BH10PLA2_03200 [soil metagenome]